MTEDSQETMGGGAASEDQSMRSYRLGVRIGKAMQRVAQETREADTKAMLDDILSERDEENRREGRSEGRAQLVDNVQDFACELLAEANRIAWSEGGHDRDHSYTSGLVDGKVRTLRDVASRLVARIKAAR